jgi:hypothetical protein
VVGTVRVLPAPFADPFGQGRQLLGPGLVTKLPVRLRQIFELGGDLFAGTADGPSVLGYSTHIGGRVVEFRRGLVSATLSKQDPGERDPVPRLDPPDEQSIPELLGQPIIAAE